MNIDFPEGSEEAMMAALGIPINFSTTKNKKVEGNVEGTAQTTPVFQYRQYMNRKGNLSFCPLFIHFSYEYPYLVFPLAGGFNRPLDAMK